MSLDLGPALRSAILDQQNAALQPLAASIVDALGKWNGVASVFAFRPVPENAGNPLILINPDSGLSDADGLNSVRPVITRSIGIYGQKGIPGDATDQSPAVEALGYQIRDLFHRQKFSMQPVGYSVIDVVAVGPISAPVDDDGDIGRLVSLTIRLRRNP